MATSWTERTKPSTTFTERVKPSTSFTGRTKPSTSFTERTKPSTSFTERDIASIWDSSVYPWQEALPWQMVGVKDTTFTGRTKP
jgi:hypothetical protein